ncbi:hypothetical protein BJY52DRAFT_473217 [Lactarius psammicola]|nr:hypothetical protein BJY52DRAFT_473217 [Lactarius psammicola]
MPSCTCDYGDVHIKLYNNGLSKSNFYRCEVIAWILQGVLCASPAAHERLKHGSCDMAITSSCGLRRSNTMPVVLPGTPVPNEVVSDETLRFDFPGSDTVLRSCDSHNFRVLKLYIAHVSPVLRELLESAPNPSDTTHGEELLPVVELSESGVIIFSLLTFVFPVTPVLPSTTQKIMELLSVAQKYQMDLVLTHIRYAISRRAPPFIRPETAFHDYFLAQKHELHQEALQAARVTLRLSLTIEDLEDKLEFMPGCLPSRALEVPRASSNRSQTTPA